MLVSHSKRLFNPSPDLLLIGSTTLKVLIEVDATALTEGDYEFRITKNGRGINRLLIQDEQLMAEYVYEFFPLRRL